MATDVVAFGSVKGSGVTTSAFAYAAAAGAGGRAVTLVEADPSGGSLLGWCPQLDPGVGLYEAVFDRDHNLATVAQPLGDITVVVAQGDPWRINVALLRPRGWRSVFNVVDGLVVVDVGRLYPGTAAAGIVGIADRVVLVSPSEPGPLAATMEWAQRGGQFHKDDARIDGGRIRIVTVDVAAHRTQRVDPAVVARDRLADGYVAHLPFDDAGVGLLYRGASTGHRSMRRSGLAGAARGMDTAVWAAARMAVSGS